MTGSDMCSTSDGAGPSNAVNTLVNQLLGGASKTQEQIRDVRRAVVHPCLAPRPGPQARPRAAPQLLHHCMACNPPAPAPARPLQLPIHSLPGPPGLALTPEAAASAAARGAQGLAIPGLGPGVAVRRAACRRPCCAVLCRSPACCTCRGGPPAGRPCFAAAVSACSLCVCVFQTGGGAAGRS